VKPRVDPAEALDPTPVAPTDRAGGPAPPQGGPPGGDPPPPERGAAIVAGLTAASRGMGLARTVVATAVVGLTYLGNTYTSTNTTSNLLFDLFAGGALAAVVIPSLSACLVADDRAGLERTASAFLNVTLLWLTPVVFAGLVLRGPVMTILTSGVHNPAIRLQEQHLGSFLLLLFLPQVWLYGMGLVATGVLQAQHRFVGPALAPLVSSVVVTASYLLYAGVEHGHGQLLSAVTPEGRLILGLGTTAGVVALTVSVLIPAGRLGLRWRPVLRIPPTARALTKRLLGSALLAVAMEQVLLGLVLIVGNGVEGGVVAYMLAFTLLELPWAILAVPIAVASFPGLASAAARNDLDAFRTGCATAARNLVVLALAGTAAMLALAGPGTRILLDLGIGGGARSAHLLAPTVAAFAPGLAGYGAYALLTRVAYALGDGRSPALGAVAGFGSASVLSLAAALLFSGAALVAGLAAAFSVGMTLGAGLMVARLTRRAGRGAFAGAGSTLARAVTACAGSALLGAGIAFVLRGGPVPRHVFAGVAAAAVTVATYLALLHLLGDRQLGRALAALRAGRTRPGRAPSGEASP
jgi:putative peptidoglycan lipid II flippase